MLGTAKLTLPLCLLVSALVQTTLQVDIKLWGAAPSYLTATCPNIQPGVCCGWLDTWIWFSNVNITGLSAFDIAAIWSPRYSPNRVMVGGCSGVVQRSRSGPGDWSWDRDADDEDGERISGDRVTGASYIRIPQNLHDTSSFSALVYEGILGLVWGGGRWFVSEAADRLLTGGNKPVPRVGRDLRLAAKGSVYARSPPRMVHPSVVEINGTEYLAGAEGSMVYVNRDTGATVNLTRRYPKEDFHD
ncbi:MAG: hypothetical protein LQ346_008817 [Caloplaca aetnensis]|nr:MAG: hypothetical protein LQ346_008817 [Caloplaca aetnensis]